MDDSSAQLIIEDSVIDDGTKPELLFVGDTPEAQITDTVDAGTAVDAAIVSEPKTEKTVDPDDEPLNKGFGKRRRKAPPTEPKSTPPDVNDWMDFFSRIVIRYVTEWYVDIVFHDINEDAVTDKDAEKLLLTEDERDTIARPFAEYANKNPFMRKHGRQIVAFADSFESMVMLGRWYMRVNRIARKYHPKNVPSRVRVNGSNNGNNGQGAEGTTGGRIPDGFSIFNPGSS